MRVRLVVFFAENERAKCARPDLRAGFSLSKKGLSGFITRQATKLMRDKMYE